MYAFASCPGLLIGPATSSNWLPTVSEIESVPAGRTQVPVTISELPGNVGFLNVTDMEVNPPASLPCTFACTRLIPLTGALAAVKLTDVDAPDIVTVYDAGVNTTPVLVGVTV
jgi:hypothetical protein